MDAIFQKAVVIVWRESLEAALVIGIIAAFLNRSKDTHKGLRWAYLGIAIGIALSVALAAGMLFAENVFVGDALEWFQTLMLLLSAVLMTQMVFWMQRNSRNLKKNIETEMTESIQASGLYSVMGVSAFAVAREGAETVVYLYGMSLEGGPGSLPYLGLSLLVGGGAALITAWALSKGFRFVNPKRVFQFTAAWLLLSAGGMMLSATSRLMESEWLPTLVDPLWDSSFLLSTDSFLGSLLAIVAGYRTQPSLTHVIVLLGYWLVVIALFQKDKLFGQKPLAGLPSM